MAENHPDIDGVDENELEIEEEQEDDDEEQDWGDWQSDADGGVSDLLCLFCDSKFSSSDVLFEHCHNIHRFDFHAIRKSMGLDFYGCFRLINYVRSQVAENRCWSCGFTCHSKKDLQDHLHENFTFEGSNLPWAEDRYLKPFMHEDSLLYSFVGDDDEGEDGDTASVNEMKDLSSFEKFCIEDDNVLETQESVSSNSWDNENKDSSNNHLKLRNHVEKMTINGINEKENGNLSDGSSKDKHLRISFRRVHANEIKNVDQNYFGSYSSFGIHREMISDKVRTDAYELAICKNPSLIRAAVVLDVGCGTGILSLFAAKAGASTVIAVEGSEKMAAVATQIAKDNGLLWNDVTKGGPCAGVIRVLHSMVEGLDNSELMQSHSIDVIVSEWMGYCLLYESMLSSVLYARDRWLKPGGAILPDTATMFAAGFGRGCTSIPFWENVYGFNMSCIGKELVEEAARLPIVDVVDSRDIVTNTAVLQSFDLVTMRLEEMDFTATIELEAKTNKPGECCMDFVSQARSCYGIVLWFETGFTSRFCKEMPTVLSTSPYSFKTHWSQTILTFPEPITLSMGKQEVDRSAVVGTDACPAMKIQSRISIARGAQHRSIDVSLETLGVGLDGQKRRWPVQMFNLA